jgi:hypothetical protein
LPDGESALYRLSLPSPASRNLCHVLGACDVTERCSDERGLAIGCPVFLGVEVFRRIPGGGCRICRAGTSRDHVPVRLNGRRGPGVATLTCAGSQRITAAVGGGKTPASSARATETGTATVTDSLAHLPTWTAICTFMGFPIWAQSQQRCPTADIGWPCFGGYLREGECSCANTNPPFVIGHLTAHLPARRGLFQAGVDRLRD